jgi:hypothetical protein
VSVGAGPTRAAVLDADELRIDGDPSCLKSLASHFHPADDARDGWHAHYEYFEGNRWVSKESEPLVIALRC